MDFAKKLAELKAKEAQLTKKLEKAESVGNQHDKDNIYALLKANQEAQSTFAAKIEADIEVPVVGWKFPATTVGFVSAVSTLVAIPIGSFATYRFAGKAWFKWRHSRVPYSPDDVIRHCRRYELPYPAFKEQLQDGLWQKDAVKGGCSGAVTTFMVWWNMKLRERSSSSSIDANKVESVAGLTS